ncbi:MAG: hypothetical protein QOH28_3097 [Actinomycetota bacterium]|jgi:hypothetical protein|nr:hypothetical protein [Actinomycetota bacterium]
MRRSRSLIEFLAPTGLTGLAIGSARSAAGNAARRSKAAREAAEKWRYIDSYRVYVTTSRIALQGSREWHDVWYVNLRTLEYDHQGITFQTSGNPRSRLRMFPTDYWFVMLRKLAYNEIYDIPTPC